MSKVLLFSFRWSDGSCAKGKNRIRNKEQEAKMKSFHQTTGKKVSAVKKKNLVWLFLFHLLYFDSLFSRLPPVPIESLRPSSSSVFFLLLSLYTRRRKPEIFSCQTSGKTSRLLGKGTCKSSNGQKNPSLGAVLCVLSNGCQQRQ